MARSTFVLAGSRRARPALRLFIALPLLVVLIQLGQLAGYATVYAAAAGPSTCLPAAAAGAAHTRLR